MTDKLNTSRSTSNIPSTQNTLMAIAAVAPTLKITDVNSGEIIGNGDTVASVPNFSGKAEPFGVISISFKLPNGGVFSARTTANAEGEWFVGAPAHLMGYTLNVTVRSGVLFSETIQITTDPNFVKPEPAQPEVPEEPVLPVVPSEPELPESPEEPITPVVINLAIDKVGEKQVLRNESSEKSDDIRPTFHGTAGALQIVTLYAGHTVLGSARADTNGDWGLQIVTDLPTGTHTIVARTENSESGTFTLNVEAPADARVTILIAVDNVGNEQILRHDSNYKTDDKRPTFHGRAGSEQIVTLYAGEKVLGSVKADINGDWILEISEELAVGINAVVARAGNRESDIFPINVEVPDEAPVAIHYAYDNVGANQYLANNQGKTDDVRPTFSGTAGIGQLVKLYSGTLLLGSVQADGKGNWNLEIVTDLPSGSHSITARTETRESSRFIINVETEADKPVYIYEAYDNVGQVQLLGSVSRVTTDDTRPTFSGSSGSNQIVTLYSGSTFLGSVQANSNGKWSLEITTDLPSGSHAIVASTEKSQSASFKINVVAPVDAPVTISHAYDNVDQHQYLSNGSGLKTDDRRPTFSGRAGSEQIVTLYSGNNVLGSVQADIYGNWSLEISNDLNSGRHDVIARTETRASDKFTITVETQADIPVTISNVVDNVGHYQTLHNGYKTDDSRPTFTGRAGSEQVVTLYSGVMVLGSVQADKNGYWSLEITTDLTSGRHEVVARTETRSSNKFTLNVEAAADVPVTITSAFDNVGHHQSVGSGSNTKIDDTRPTFSGRSGADQVVTLYSGVTMLGSVQADKNGYWSLEITTNLTSGRHEFIARTETLASNKFTLNVEAAADVPVTITSAFDGVGHQHRGQFGYRKLLYVKVVFCTSELW